MRYAKMFGRFVTMSLFRFCILLLPVLIATVAVFGTASHTQGALQASGLYNNFVTAVLDQSLKENNDAQAQQLLADRGVRDAVNKSFTPDVLQTATEQATNGIYDWLLGKTAQPSFQIDLSKARAQLITNLTDYAKQRADGLPVCTLAQLRQLNTDQNLLNLPCRPQNLDTTAAAKQFSDDVLKNTDFLGNTTITAANLPKDASGKTFFQQHTQVPDAFHLFVISPWVIGGLALISALLLVLLHDRRRAGISAIGWTILGSGVFWLAGAILYGYLFNHLKQNLTFIDNVDLRSSISKVVSSLAGDVIRNIYLVAATFIILGAALLIGLRLTRQAQAIPTEPSAEEPVTDSASDTLSAQAAHKEQEEQQ